MKVTCIKTIQLTAKEAAKPFTFPRGFPVAGEVYTVAEKITWYGSDYFIIEEKPIRSTLTGQPNGWDTKFFANAAHYHEEFSTRVPEAIADEWLADIMKEILS